MSNKRTKSVLSLLLSFTLIVTTMICLTLIHVNAEWSVTKVSDIYEDNFDSYTDGSDINGQNNWISQSRKVNDVIYSHVVSNSMLRLEDKNQNGWRCFRTDRPEKKVNQRVKFDIIGLKDVKVANNANVSAQLRYQGDDAADSDGNPGPTNTYFATANDTNLSIYYMSGVNSSTQWSKNPTCADSGKATMDISSLVVNNHIYTLEFVAANINPTVLVANLYDKTDSDKLVATVSCEDSSSDLQKEGMAAVAYKSKNLNEYLYIDNFVYDEVSVAQSTNPDTDPDEGGDEESKPVTKDYPKYFEDSFDSYSEGTEINGKNDWYSVSRSIKKSQIITGGALKAEDFKYSDTYLPNGSFTALTSRPNNESAINEKVTVDILNMDTLTNTAHAGIHLRVMPVCAFYDTAQTNIKSINTYLLSVSAGSLQIKYTTGGSEKTITDVNAVDWNFTGGHKYRVEFSAEGLYPTKLKARIYDIDSSDRLIVETTAEDSTSDLQCAGSCALSHTADGAFANSYTLFDNFKYEQIDTVNYYDSFDSSTLDSDWILASKAAVSQQNGYITLKTKDAVANTHYESESTVMRPEKSLNQIVNVEWSRNTQTLNTGATAILRSQDDNGSFSNSYQAHLEIGRGSVNSNHGWLMVTNGKDTILSEEVQWLTGTANLRLEFSAISISTTETQLTVNIYRQETYGGLSVWRCRYSKTITDSTEKLQKRGNAGFSLYDLNCGTINIYSFSYCTPSDSYKSFELEDDSTTKNLYKTLKDSNANGGSLVTATKNKNAASYDKITKLLDHNSPFISFAVSAKSEKGYNIKLSYRMNWSNPTQGVEPYATLVVNNVAYKFPYNSSYGDIFETSEKMVNLKAGTNIIYLLAPTAELPGATIDYDSMFYEEGLEISNAELIAAGDANGDGTVDIRDMVHFNNYLKNSTDQIKFDAVERLIKKSDESSWETGDIKSFSKYLLAMGTDDEKYNDLSWYTYKAATFLNNTLYKLNNNKALNVAYMGGSVTDGYGSSDASLYSWRARTTSWLKGRFPDAADGIIENEAAVGGTGSDFGMYRAVNDLFLDDENQKPDLLFLEFAINDAYDGVGQDGASLGLESIINSVYDYSPETDIVVVLTTDASRGASDYDTLQGHIDIANKYRLPYIKVGKQMWQFLSTEASNNGTSLETERKKYYRTLPDGNSDYVHPNDDGYGKYAEFVTADLEDLFSSVEQDTPKACVNSWRPTETMTEIPYKPVSWKATNLTGTSGWYVINDDTFTTGVDNVGASFSFKFTGTELKTWAWGFAYAPTVSVSIDGGPVTEVELYRSYGNHKVFTLAENLSCEEHTVTITYTKAPVVPDDETDPEPYSQKVSFREFFTSGAEDAKFTKVN